MPIINEPESGRHRLVDLHKDPSTKWLNFAERVMWTLLQAASAEGLLTLWTDALHHTLQASERAFWLVALTTALAAIKNAAAQAFGSPSGATLPQDKQPVLAEKVVAITPPPETDEDLGAPVAWTGSAIENGTQVVVQPADAA